MEANRKFYVTIRTDMGDRFQDENKGEFWGANKFDVKSHLETIYGAETESRFYLIKE